MAQHRPKRRGVAAESYPRVIDDPASKLRRASVDKPPSRRQEQDGGAGPSHARGTDAHPTGVPNSDRHAAETAHFKEDEDPDAL
jgi:hypothetical protein